MRFKSGLRQLDAQLDRIPVHAQSVVAEALDMISGALPAGMRLEVRVPGSGFRSCTASSVIWAEPWMLRVSRAEAAHSRCSCPGTVARARRPLRSRNCLEGQGKPFC